jgi:hypothetical protein
MIDLDMSGVKPSVMNFLLVGLLSVSFIVSAKYLVNRYDNFGTRVFRDVLNAV